MGREVSHPNGTHRHSTIPNAARSGRKRRDAIVDTLAQVPAITPQGIAELCEVNGFGKGAFYYYIESKEELLAAYHDREMDEV